MQVKDITVRTVPSDVLAFRILSNGNPVYGANVTLCTKGLIPISFTRVTDVGGVVEFSAYDITDGMVPPAAVKEIPWLFMAYLPDSEYAIWKDNIKFDVGMLHVFKLKKYTKAPTFWIKVELKDIIGAELFSNLIAEVEKAALDWAGMEVVEVKGQGTRVVTVHFKPPFHESPIVVEWVTVWFIFKVLAVAGAIIAVLVVLKWSFGEAFVQVVGGGVFLLLVFAALALAKPAVEKVRKRERE